MALSRRTYSESKRYETVVFGENTHPGDFEMVELQDIQNGERNALGAAIITDGFLLDGFRAVGSGLSNAVSVTFGTGYSEGRRMIMPDSLHQSVGGQYFFNFPNATPVVSRNDLLYVDVYVDTVDQTADPVIEDPSLGPSATRERVRYNFAISEGNVSGTPPSLPVGHVGYPIANITRRAGDPLVQAADVSDIRPRASLNSQFKPQNLIIVSPAGGDFEDPVAALNSITSSSATNRYTILIRPGVYTVSATLDFVNPYVTMIGTDPFSCAILVDTNGYSACTINADNVAIKGLSLGFATGSSPHYATILVNGAYSIDLDDLILSEDFYNENDTNICHGINTTTGGTVRIHRCTIYAQNSTTDAAVVVGASAAVDMDNCTIIAANNDALSVANGGVVNIHKCSFTTTNSLMVSGGTLTATDSQWVNLPLKTFAVGPTPLTLTNGVTNTMDNCLLDGRALGAIQEAHITDESLIWTRMTIYLQMFTSGGGSSYYRSVLFMGGIDVNGTGATFEDCDFALSGASWGIPGVTGNYGLILRGSNSPLIKNCTSRAGRVAFILGGTPTFKGCRFSSSTGGVEIIYVLSTSTDVVVDGCLFQLYASYTGSGVIQIGANGGSAKFTFTNNQCSGSSLGQPPYVLFGFGTGAALYAGGNSSTATALRDVTTITAATNIAQNP